LKTFEHQLSIELFNIIPKPKLLFCISEYLWKYHPRSAVKC